MTENPLNQLKLVNLTKRRAGAEVIASVLLVAITVVGAVILTTFLDETLLASGTAESSRETAVKTVRLLEYDTRDSDELLRITTLSNNFDSRLFRTSLPGDEDRLPENGGTEFLAMRIQNQGVGSIWIKNIQISGVDYSWDNLTANVPLDASADSTGGDYPRAGTFSISSDLNELANPIQNDSAEVESGETVNVFVKLAPDASDDYDLNQALRIIMNIGSIAPVDFVIESGAAQ